MDGTARRIAVVQGASGATVQELFLALARRWAASLRLAGVVAEDHGLADRACNAGFLRRLGSGERFAMFDDLGPGTRACHLDGAGVLAAAAAVRRDIAAGCDLVVLSKFGKLEAAGGGLRDAFTAAIEAGVPILTTVGRSAMPAWQAFAAPGWTAVAAEVDAVETWWHTLRQPRFGASPRPASA